MQWLSVSRNMSVLTEISGFWEADMMRVWDPHVREGLTPRVFHESSNFRLTSLTTESRWDSREPTLSSWHSLAYIQWECLCHKTRCYCQGHSDAIKHCLPHSHGLHGCDTLWFTACEIRETVTIHNIHRMFRRVRVATLTEYTMSRWLMLSCDCITSHRVFQT